MSHKDLSKYEVVKRTIRREITAKKAGELLHRTERQIYNLKTAVKKKGAAGVIHGNRGKPSNRRMPEGERQKIVKLLRRFYADFRPTHASEKLATIHGLIRDPKTVRQIMIGEGIWRPKKQHKIAYRCLRPRRDHYGEMEQFDGSYHHWLEDRGGTGEMCLLAAIDDATGRITHARFARHEGVLPVFTFWKEYLLTHGKPRAIYLDRLRTYHNNLLPEQDEDMLTQFQRAMHELAIEPIVAHSPQAKGRIERLFHTLQDRLVKELRLRTIADGETANEFLQNEFLSRFNERYSVPPLKNANLHRTLTAQEQHQLPAILSRQSERTVQNDFTIRFNNQWYQLTKEQPATVRPQERVLLEERLDSSLHIRLRGKYLHYRILPAKPQKQHRQSWVIAASQKPARKPHKPPPDHPWRKPFLFPKHEISISLKT